MSYTHHVVGGHHPPLIIGGLAVTLVDQDFGGIAHQIPPHFLQCTDLNKKHRKKQDIWRSTGINVHVTSGMCECTCVVIPYV